MKNKAARKESGPVQLDRDWIKGVPLRGDLRSPVRLAQWLLREWTHREAINAWNELEKVFKQWKKENRQGDSDLHAWQCAGQWVNDPIDLVFLIEQERYAPYISLLDKWGVREEVVLALICLRFASIEGVGLGLVEPYFKHIDSVFALKAGYWVAANLLTREMNKSNGQRLREDSARYEGMAFVAKSYLPIISARNRQKAALTNVARKKAAENKSKRHDDKLNFLGNILKILEKDKVKPKGAALHKLIRDRWEQTNEVLRKNGASAVLRAPKEGSLKKLLSEWRALQKNNVHNSARPCRNTLP